MISIGIAPNQKELGAKLGYTSESAFSQIINGKKSEPENLTTRLRTLLPSLNLSWLLTGEIGRAHV